MNRRTATGGVGLRAQARREQSAIILILLPVMTATALTRTGEAGALTMRLVTIRMEPNAQSAAPQRVRSAERRHPPRRIAGLTKTR